MHNAEPPNPLGPPSGKIRTNYFIFLRGSVWSDLMPVLAPLKLYTNQSLSIYYILTGLTTANTACKPIASHALMVPTLTTTLLIN